MTHRALIAAVIAFGTPAHSYTCAEVRDMAEQIMTIRQNDVPVSEAPNAIAGISGSKKVIAHSLVAEAYTWPIQLRLSAQGAAIIVFANYAEELCESDD